MSLSGAPALHSLSYSLRYKAQLLSGSMLWLTSQRHILPDDRRLIETYLRAVVPGESQTCSLSVYWQIWSTSPRPSHRYISKSLRSTNQLQASGGQTFLRKKIWRHLSRWLLSFYNIEAFSFDFSYLLLWGSRQNVYLNTKQQQMSFIIL